METVCKSCGGSIQRVENYYICDFCGNKWEIDSSNDVHAVDRANAWAALRDGNFEKAAELFEGIIAKEPKNHEAYWGRALALAGIVYVTDLNENKKIPTCNNITENSFRQNKDVCKAISLAPADIASTYQDQAEYINKVRLEWLEKASKEPSYDVFISFKDSDRENGITRTQDSIDAQDLYSALTAEGYKVFFSRISLRDKISEQYEPYIYNAIRTAKVMIVFGERAEYFSSVWIKNEWSRFRTRIEKGEKHRNSLVVVYKNMNPQDLPVVLKARQCMNAADMTFLSDLLRHIKRVVAESKETVHLEKIQIAGGQISRKATALSVNTVQMREVGAGAIAETSISEQQSLKLMQAYLDEGQWQQVQKLAEDVLFDNPNCVEALWSKLLASKHAASGKALVSKLNSFTVADFAAIDKVLNCSSKGFAETVLDLLYHSEKETTDAAYSSVLKTILPYSFSRRQKCIDAAFSNVIAHGKYESFQRLLNTLESQQVDRYISYNLQFAEKTEDNKHKQACLNAVLKVDEGNVTALREILLTQLKTYKPGMSLVTGATLVSSFEKLLKYAPDGNEEVKLCLGWLVDYLSGAGICEFSKRLIRYYTGEISDLKEPMIKLSYQMLKQQQFKYAEYFLNLVLSFDPDNPEVYWGICLLRIGASSEASIMGADLPLQDVPEFNRYLILVGDERRKQCIALAKRQSELSTRRIRQQTIKKLTDEKNQTEAEVEHLTEEVKRLPVKRTFSKLIIYAFISLCIGAYGAVDVIQQAYWNLDADEISFWAVKYLVFNYFNWQTPAFFLGVAVVLFLIGGWINSMQPSRAQVRKNIVKVNALNDKIRELRLHIQELEQELNKLG